MPVALHDHPARLSFCQTGTYAHTLTSPSFAQPKGNLGTSGCPSNPRRKALPNKAHWPPLSFFVSCMWPKVTAEDAYGILPRTAARSKFHLIPKLPVRTDEKEAPTSGRGIVGRWDISRVREVLRSSRIVAFICHPYARKEATPLHSLPEQATECGTWMSRRYRTPNQATSGKLNVWAPSWGLVYQKFRRRYPDAYIVDRENTPIKRTRGGGRVERLFIVKWKRHLTV